MNKKIFCIDSDGCVMDTMTYKHELFFGRIAAEIFEVDNKISFLKDWNKVNLYSKTRGINRFLGLIITLELNGVKEIDELKKWAYSTNELSNQSLEKEIRINGAFDLIKALKWSSKVNQEISNSKELDKPFCNAYETIQTLKKYGEIVVVSSANKEAVQEEWQRHGFLDLVDELYCQDKGKKEEIIRRSISQMDDLSQVLMIGDSPGDLEAAEKNGIQFYPILVGKEKESWIDLKEKFLPLFLDGKYSDCKGTIIKKFWSNLN